MDLGLGLLAQIMFGSRPVSGLVQVIGIKQYIEHLRLYWAILFYTEKFIVALILFL
jgi:hypothetical protein